MISNRPTLSRREFLWRAGIVSTALACPLPSFTAASTTNKIVVFSKIYQELKLSYEESAELTAQAGLHGVDCALRPGGEILPERVDEDLPRYLAALKKHGLSMPMIASGITGPDTPHTERVLNALSKAGIRYYRLAPIRPDKNPEKRSQQVTELRSRLKDLAAINKQLGVTAMAQNHSPASGYIGGDVAELGRILEGFVPAEIGAAFDLGHAIVVHGKEWPNFWQKIKSHLAVAYVKDVNSADHWVPFGQGEFASSDYFSRLKALNYTTPYSIHIEFDWHEGGKSRNRETLLKSLKHSRETLQAWLAKT